MPTAGEHSLSGRRAFYAGGIEKSGVAVHTSQ